MKTARLVLLFVLASAVAGASDLNPAYFRDRKSVV